MLCPSVCRLLSVKYVLWLNKRCVLPQNSLKKQGLKARNDCKPEAGLQSFSAWLLSRMVFSRKDVSRKVVSWMRMIIFPGKDVSRQDDSRMVTFPERRFPGGHFPGWDNFLWLIYRRTPNMNNTLYKFIPRRKANWLALLTTQGYANAKCLSSTTVLRLMSYETSKVRLKLHLFRLSYPGLVL